MWKTHSLSIFCFLWQCFWSFVQIKAAIRSQSASLKTHNYSCKSVMMFLKPWAWARSCSPTPLSGTSWQRSRLTFVLHFPNWLVGALIDQLVINSTEDLLQNVFCCVFILQLLFLWDGSSVCCGWWSSGARDSQGEIHSSILKDFKHDSSPENQFQDTVVM